MGPSPIADGLNVHLLLLLDSRSPAGGHGHSGGVEAAVNAGFVRDLTDLREFSTARLETAGLVSAAFAALSHRACGERATPAQWQRIDAEFEARTVSPALRIASRSLGRGLRRLIRASAPSGLAELDRSWILCPRPAPHHPLVLGAACAVAGGSSLDAARAAANSCVSVAGSASLRLLGLDPYEVHALNHQLVADIERIASDAHARVTAHDDLIETARMLPAVSAPAMDVLAEFHLQQEVRLFAS